MSLQDEQTTYDIPEPRPSLTPDEKARRRKRRIQFRLGFYGTFLVVLYGLFWYQPYQFDFIPRKLPNPNPAVDPDSKRLFAKGTKILVVTAHPDDSEFYIGGLLTKLAQSGADLHQVICTDGDKGYYFFFTNAAENRRVRRQEAENALHAWNGKSLDLLGYPDRFLHANDDVVAKIEAAIERIKPDYILSFDPDYPQRMSHTDHRRCGEATKIAADKTHVAKWLLMFQTIAPNYVEDITDLWDDKKNLLAIHKSQFYGKHLEGVENMVGDMAERDGARAGYEMGEGLRCVKLQ